MAGVRVCVVVGTVACVGCVQPPTHGASTKTSGDECGASLSPVTGGTSFVVAQVYDDDTPHPWLTWPSDKPSMAATDRAFAVLDDDGYVGTVSVTERHVGPECRVLAVEGLCRPQEDWYARWVDGPLRRPVGDPRRVLAFGPVDAPYPSAHRVVPPRAVALDENNAPLPPLPRADGPSWTQLVLITTGGEPAAIEVRGRRCASGRMTETRLLEKAGGWRLIRRTTQVDDDDTW